MPAPGSLLGAVIELDIGAPAAGGACVGRHDGRVVFVRHTLPGERVRALVTEDRGGRFLRAEAVEVLVTSPDRVPVPCPYARPGRCGGCDWQHATGAAQRAIKAQVVGEQFARLAGIDVGDLQVEELPGGLLGWRTRITYAVDAVDAAGRPGLHRHRSHDLEPVDRCLLGVPGVGDAPLLRQRWPGVTGVEVARGDAPEAAVLTHRPGPGRQARGRRPPDRVQLAAGPARLRHEVLGQAMEVSAGGFWQVHPAAVEAFARALLDALAPAPGEQVLDLYAGAGALTAVLAEAVGPTGRVVAVESAAGAVEDAERNLAGRPWVQVRRARVDESLFGRPLFGAAPSEGSPSEGAPSDDGPALRPDLVVLDPPRAGAGAAVMRGLLGLGPRAVGYVSCDPATLARDVAVAQEQGWRLAGLRAFDAFPMTHHVECVATLHPDSGAAAP